MEKKLYRNEHGKMIGGVCSGIADYLAIDPTIVRLVFLAMLIGHGAGFLIYIILLIVLPKHNVFTGPNFKPGVDYRVPPTQPFGQPFTFPPIPPKKSSNAGMICGAILIVLGSIFLIDNLDIIPDWDFDRLWPLVIVAAGAALLFAGQKKQPWEKPDWNATVTPAAGEPAAESNAADKTSAFDLTKKNDEPSTDNPTTI
ncbi:PspC domain-containing protein [Mucilaginibacter sp.]|uniref:PspC domain-containing protein n=1 Tax=Mucilaginibacter sp. TaxID=1882438 RepID=UPI003266D8BB